MNRCRLCRENNLHILFDFAKHPIAHRFLDQPSQEEYVHPFVVAFCESCGMIQLYEPIAPEVLYVNYVCLSSWKYQPHIPRLIELTEQYVENKNNALVLEVGSNDGRFLSALSKKGFQKVVGIEPAKDAQSAAKELGILTMPLYFNVDSAKEFVKNYGKCDFFVSRQMLEHIDDLEDFKEAMHVVLKPGSRVLFEMPNFQTNLMESDYAFWEEHINYFTPETVNLFLTGAGISVLHSESILFSGDTLVIVGEYTGNPPVEFSRNYLPELKSRVYAYRGNWPIFRNKFIDYMQSYRERGGKIAVYGAGARLCSLVNFIGMSPYIEFIVDDQPYKQGKYMPGSGLPILPSTALQDEKITLCLLAVNTECEEAVMLKHQDFVRRGGEFVSVLPPSERLPQFWKQFLGARIKI